MADVTGHVTRLFEWNNIGQQLLPWLLGYSSQLLTTTERALKRKVRATEQAIMSHLSRSVRFDKLRG